MAKTITAILSLKDDFTKSLAAAKNASKNFGSEWERQIRACEKAGKRMESMGGSLTRTITSSVGKMAAAGGALVALAGKQGLDEAMNLQGYKTQLDTATKDTQKSAKIMQNAVKLANSTPYEAGELVQASAKFEAMGMSADKWMKITGDMAAATNKDFDQATEAIIDAQQGELERLKEFGLSKAMIQAKADEMFGEQQTINNKGQIINQENFNKAMMSLMKEKYAGGMEAQAKTLRGMMSTISGIWKSGLATILGMTSDGTVRTGSALDIMGNKVQALAAKFTEWQENGTIDELALKFDKISTSVMEVAVPVFSALGSAVKSAIDWFTGLSPTMQRVVVAIGLIVTAVGPLMAGFGSLLTHASALLPVFGAVARVFGTIKSVAGLLIGAVKLMVSVLGGPLTLAIGAVITVGVLLYKNWDKVKEIGVNAFNKVKEVINNVKTAISNLKNAVIDFIQNSKIGHMVSSVTGAISGVREAIGGNADGTNYWKGGLTAVHERGGEIIDLQRGARVYPHDKSVQMAYRDGQQNSAGNINVNFDGSTFVVREEADVDRIATAIVRKLTLTGKNRRVMA